MKKKISNSSKIELLRKMIRIRVFEDKVSEVKNSGKIPGSVHCAHGEEAIDVGACSALSANDYIIGTHRSHGYMIAKGANINHLMAEIYGKKTGTNGGKGGSMHVSDISIGSLGATAIVGSGLPVACGAAFASKYKNEGRVSCVFFGDGASNEGAFHESMNLASIWKLPVIFFLINNGVAITTLLKNVSPSQDLYQRANSYGIKSIQIDGQNVEEVYSAVKNAIDHITEGKGAVLIEAKTVRFHEHAEGYVYARMADVGYRDNEELKYFIENQDPIVLYSKKLLEEKILASDEIKNIYSEETRSVEKAIEFAEKSPIPDIKDVYKNIYI